MRPCRASKARACSSREASPLPRRSTRREISSLNVINRARIVELLGVSERDLILSRSETECQSAMMTRMNPTLPIAVAALVSMAAIPSVAAESSTPSARLGQVVLPSGHVLEVEVADTPAKVQRGYMFRKRVSDREGMVFLLGSLDFHPFWMKNCRVSLDIIWLDETWKVVHIERELPPCKEKAPCPSHQPLQASLYVLEVQAGLATREGLSLGDHIIFNAPSPSAPGFVIDTCSVTNRPTLR